MFRTALTRQARLFTTTSRFNKSALDSGKEALDAASRAVGDAAAKGIKGAEDAAQAIKETVGFNAEKAQGQASGTASEVSGKASELAGQAKGKAHEVAGQVKGKAEEVKSKM